MNRVTEERLSEAFAVLLRHAADGSPLPSLEVVLSEFEALQGCADYVGAIGGIAEMREAASAGCGRVLERPAAASVYGHLRSAPRTVMLLAKRTGLSTRTVRDCLRDLRESGLADETPSGCFTRGATRLPHAELWAFEIKVSDWRRALFQAIQYQAFAHRVAVVIASEYAHRATAQVALFRRFGVGLLIIDNIDSSPTLRRVAAPRRRAPSSGTYHLHALGRVIASAT